MDGFASRNTWNGKMLPGFPLRVEPFHGWRQTWSHIIIHPITSFQGSIRTQIAAVRSAPHVATVWRLILVRRLHVVRITKNLIIAPLTSKRIHLLRYTTVQTWVIVYSLVISVDVIAPEHVRTHFLIFIICLNYFNIKQCVYDLIGQIF